MKVLIGALVIGMTLGLLGSGGSTLTLPVLVYVLGHEDKIAVAESLAIVGGIALSSVVPFARQGLVRWRSVIFFGIPGMIGAWGGAWLARFVSGPFQLTLFAIVMLTSSVVMYRSARKRSTTGERERRESPGPDDAASEHLPSATLAWISLFAIVAQGLGVGTLAGLIGVGGGFLIVPALVILGRLPMRHAIGTSLTVIFMMCVTGFMKHASVLHSTHAQVDWWTIGAFILIGACGSLVGRRLGSRFPQQRLRQLFAVFLVLMGVFVLAREIPKLMSAAETPSDRPVTRP